MTLPLTDLNTFGWLFLVALLLGTGLQIWLALRQGRYVAAHAGEVPPAFADRVTADAHRKAAAYTAAKLRVEVASLLLGALVLFGWTLGGGLEALHSILADLPVTAFWQGVLMVAAVLLIGFVIELPLMVWRTFGVESAFGFNRTSVSRFLLDGLLGIGLAVGMGGPLLVAALWLMDSTGDLWWLAVWVLWTGFSLLVTWAFPRFIAPLFNRFSPLADADLRLRLERLLERCGFAADGVFVMDGSRRSAHGNAYFTGLGRSKRIVFFDTLLQQLAPAEIEAVLAHELGHYHHKHVQKGLLMTMLLSFAGLALLGWLVHQPWFYAGLGVSDRTAALALVLFLLAVPVFAVFVQPLFAALSRRHEFEADAYAAARSDGAALVGGLVKLYRDNASSLVADPLYAAFHYSHPPATERVARLEAP